MNHFEKGEKVNVSRTSEKVLHLGESLRNEVVKGNQSLIIGSRTEITLGRVLLDNYKHTNER